MPSAPSPTQAKKATSAMLCRVLLSRGSSGLPNSLRRSEASAMSARFLQLLLEAAAEHGHFLRRLLVALALGDGDAFAVCGERFFRTARFGQRPTEQLPGCRV